MEQRRLFLDPGVLLNLCVVKVAAEMLAVLPYRMFATSSTCRVLYATDHEGDMKSYSAERLVAQGMVGAVDLQAQDASERFIELACLGLRGTAGELAALASLSGGMMATDDQATIRLMMSYLPEVPLLTTGALVHEYAELMQVPRLHISDIVATMREHAYFSPGERDPFRDWWMAHLHEP